MTPLTRRRFLTISAATLAAGTAHGAAQARWQGQALGAPASMQIAGLSQDAAHGIFQRVEHELARLEGIFSLYRPASEISRLNAAGHLDAPSPEMLELLSLCTALHAQSGGAFDPSVQPLWHALAMGGNTQAARKAVGWHHLQIAPEQISFTRPGAAITLNGIAQGAVTDRIAALLRAEGLRDVLIDMGEIAALGTRQNGTEWQVGIASPSGMVKRRLSLRDRAVATSAPGQLMIGTSRDVTHILDATGNSAHRALISVSAPTAALADGLSTALCLMTPQDGITMLAEFPGATLEYAG